MKLREYFLCAKKKNAFIQLFKYGKEELLNKLFSWKLWLNTDVTLMTDDYFVDVLGMFVDLDHSSFLAVWRVRKLSDFIKNIFICVPKMNKGLTGLDWHEGE